MLITLIGAGRVAKHLGPALYKAGHRFGQVYSRTLAHASDLAVVLGAEAVNQPSAIKPGADLYLCALSDDALTAVLDGMMSGILTALRVVTATSTEQTDPSLSVSDRWANPMLVHTAGSLPLSVLAPYTNRAGVLYPMQTFSSNRAIDLTFLPCFVEATDGVTMQVVSDLAADISNAVNPLGSEQRLTLHLAAVFASNFVNHLYGVAGRLLEEEGLDFSLLLPLIDETAAKVHDLTPYEAQTGPAVRNDLLVMNKHLALLRTHPERAALYKLLSEHIYQSSP